MLNTIKSTQSVYQINHREGFNQEYKYHNTITQKLVNVAHYIIQSLIPDHLLNTICQSEEGGISTSHNQQKNSLNTKRKPIYQICREETGGNISHEKSFNHEMVLEDQEENSTPLEIRNSTGPWTPTTRNARMISQLSTIKTLSRLGRTIKRSQIMKEIYSPTPGLQQTRIITTIQMKRKKQQN